MSFAGDNYVVPGANPNIGQPGANGESASVAVGAVTTLAPGTPASVVNVGTPQQALFDFGIPSGYDGDAATIQVGTTTTLPAGSPAVVSNSGTQNNAIFDFSIPQGIPGSSVLQTQAFGNNAITTAAIIATAVPLSTVGFTTTALSDLYANASATIQTTSNTIYNISYYITIDGTKLNTTNFIHSFGGAGHYATINISGFYANLSVGAHTLRLWALTTAPAGTMTCVAQTTTGLANLI